MHLKQNIIYAYLLLMLTPACAGIDLNDSLTLDGSIRYHYETFRGFNEKEYGEDPTIGKGSKDLILTRTRIGLNYNPAWNMAAKITIQDSHAWNYGFADRDWYSKEFKMQDNSQINYVDLAETYFETRDLSTAPTLRIGRQSITYDNALLLGDGAWKNNQRLWDGLKYSYRNAAHYIDLFYGKTLLYEPDQLSLTHRYQYEGTGIYSHYQTTETSAVESYILSKINTQFNDTYNYIKYYYYGARVYDADLNNFSYDLTYIRQAGSIELPGSKTAVPELKHMNAYMYRWETGYKFNDIAGRPKIAVSKTYASGENTSTNASEKFDGAYASTTKYLGRMGIMSLSAINDQTISVAINPFINSTFRVDAHQFYLTTRTDTWYSYQGKAIGNNKNKNYTHIGNELDITLDHKLSDNLSMLFGYCIFTPGDLLKNNYANLTKHIEYPKQNATYGFYELSCKF